MHHIVSYEPYICPGCLKQNSGSAEQLLDLVICPDCGDKYKQEMLPKLKELVYNYFNVDKK